MKPILMKIVLNPIALIGVVLVVVNSSLAAAADTTTKTANAKEDAKINVNILPPPSEEVVKEPQVGERFYEQAWISALNKITSRTFRAPVNINTPLEFGNLVIKSKGCWVGDTGALDAVESRALVVIWEHKPGEELYKLFEGWLWSSSPGFSTLEHPVYDVSLMRCNK